MLTGLRSGNGGLHPADLNWLLEYEPDALVAPLEAALVLADRKRRGLLVLPSLSAAILVLTTVGEMPLTAHDRDLLWCAFGVPVFEQLLDAGGRVVANECEVHDGLHLMPGIKAGDLDGEITADHCECGSETPRLRRTHHLNNLSALPPRILARSASAA